MSKPTRLRPSQGGRFREVRPSPELVAQIRATEDRPRAIFFKGWDLEPTSAPKAPALPYLKAVAGPASTLTFPETERPALEWFCAQTWPRRGYRIEGEPETYLAWAYKNDLCRDFGHYDSDLTPKGRDLWEHNRKAPGPATACQEAVAYFNITTPEEGAATKVIDVGLPPGTSAALADFNAWVEVFLIDGRSVESERAYLLRLKWPLTHSARIGPKGVDLGLAYASGPHHHLTDRGRAALAAGRAHYAPKQTEHTATMPDGRTVRAIIPKP